jgi:outer membrane protein
MDIQTQQSLESLVSKAKQFNPQLNTLKLAIKAADAKVKEVRSGHYPQVGLFFDRTHLDGNYDGGFINSDNRNSWTIGIGVKMSLFNGGLTTAQVNTEQLKAEQLKEQNQYVEQGLATAIKNQFIELGSAIEQKKLGAEAYKSSSENVDLSHRAFKIGATDIQEVIHANYFNQIIHSNLLKAQHDALLSFAEIENMVGTIDEEVTH